MNDAALKPDTRDIVVDEVFPHTPETIWRTLTTGELIARWLMMPTTAFEPVEGKHFTFQTAPAGAWDGVVHCQVLEVMPNERLVYAWKGGHDGNVGYGSRLDTVVTWTLSRVTIYLTQLTGRGGMIRREASIARHRVGSGIAANARCEYLIMSGTALSSLG